MELNDTYFLDTILESNLILESNPVEIIFTAFFDSHSLKLAPSTISLMAPPVAFQKVSRIRSPSYVKSTPSTPSPRRRETQSNKIVVYSYLYDPSLFPFTSHDNLIHVPFQIPLDSSIIKPDQDEPCSLTIEAKVTDADSNVKTFLKKITVKPIITVKLSLASTDSLFLAVTIENILFKESSFQINDIQVQISNSIVNMNETSLSMLPLELNPQEQASLLFRIIPLDNHSPSSLQSLQDSFNSKTHSIDILVIGSTQSSKVSSRWYSRADLTDNSEFRRDIVAKYGRIEQTIADTLDNIPLQSSGIYISFSVSSSIKHSKIFSIQTMILNKSLKPRRLKLVVPNKYRISSVINDDSNEAIPIVLPPKDLYNRHVEFEKREASLVCLETDAVIGPLEVGACQTVNLHFIPLKGQLHVIELVKVFDMDSGLVALIRDPLKVLVE